MTKKLNMVFKTATDKEVTISLANPKDGLTKAEVTAVMNDIIAKSIFTNKNGALASVADVTIKTTDEVAIA